MQNKLSLFFQKHSIKGFLDHDEGLALNRYALQQAEMGPCLELGSYCGKSTVYLGWACREKNQTLYAVDHHRGSEEHQLGELYHDSELYNASLGAMDSFPAFRSTVALSGLDNTVVAIVASSALARRDWQTPLSMVFIDGGHSEAMATSDCVEWSKKLAPNGVLAVHDIFERPEDGGQGPYLGMKAVLESDDFIFEQQVKTLAFLRKK